MYSRIHGNVYTLIVRPALYKAGGVNRGAGSRAAGPAGWHERVFCPHDGRRRRC